MFNIIMIIIVFIISRHNRAIYWIFTALKLKVHDMIYNLFAGHFFNYFSTKSFCTDNKSTRAPSFPHYYIFFIF